VRRLETIRARHWAKTNRLRSMQCAHCRYLVGVPASWPIQHCRQCGEALVPFALGALAVSNPAKTLAARQGLPQRQDGGTAGLNNPL
jgi:hypothetical protein